MNDILDKWLPAINLDEELKTFENKVNRLTAIESDILAAVENEEIQPGRKRKKEVEFWLNNVTTKKSQFSQIKNEIKEEGSSRNLKGRIEKEIKEVEELILQGNFPNGVALDDHASTRLPMVTTKLVGQSFAENSETISKLLKEDSVSVVGVYGMGGVGKTTLAKEIHNILMSDSKFGRRVYWVTASRDCSFEKLQNDIGKEVGVRDFSTDDIERRKALLFRRISDMRNSVLIIDDLWNHYLLERIGIPLESCKVLVTTRSWDVCRKMQCQQVFKILPLSEPDSWTLFIRYSGDVSSELIDIAKKIVGECGGLPLALKTMGSCMRDNVDVHEWEHVLYELRKPAMRQNEMEDEVFRILKFSFDNLKDVKVQSCFLNCLLFTEDAEIFQDRLVDVCINEGLLDEIENEEDKVNKVHVMLNRLVNACLLEYGYEIRWVKMHDLIRDMGIIITQKHPRFMAKAGVGLKKVPEEEQWSSDLVKVSLSQNKIEKIPSGMTPMTPNLTVLWLNENPLKEIPESFFRHMKALKVLHLSKSHIERVPESVSDLVNLRVLNLSESYIKRLPENVSDLVNLRVLDLSYCDIERVPESASDLVNLRALLLCQCLKLKYLPSVVKLTKLRVLNLKKCYKLEAAPIGLELLKDVEITGCFPWHISKKNGFNKFMQSSLISLCYYTFWIRDPTFFKTFYDDVVDEAYLYRRIVTIAGWEYRENESSWMFPKTLELLVIMDSDMKERSLEDVLPSLGVCLGEATNFKEIRIFDSRGMISIGALDSFSQLQQLILFNCRDMKVVFSFTEHPPHLPNLETINIYNCEGVEEIFQLNNNASLSQSQSQSNPIILSLPKLESLYLNDLPKLRSIYRGLLLCSSLGVFELERCPKLKLLPMPKCMISDKSWSPTTKSILENTKLWDSLRRDYPREAGLLSFSDSSDTDDDQNADDIDEDDDKTKWGASLSLSLPPLYN